MQRQREASEPCSKAESGSQPTHNKRIARLSATVPEVQIPGGAGIPRNANVPWRALLAGVSAKRATEQPMHLNRDKTRKIHCNSLRNFPLHGFNKHISWFRCSGKGKHLNPAARQNQALNQLTTNVLQDFQKLYPRFRSQAGLECRRLQMCPGGTSGWGIRQTRNRTAQASEPRQNPKNTLQFIEKLSITRIQQASPLVQIQR